MLKCSVKYRSLTSPLYPVVIASSFTLMPLVLIIASGLNAVSVTISVTMSSIGLSIFCSLRRQQKNQPRTISVSEVGVLTLNDRKDDYLIAPSTRCTPWFIMLSLAPCLDIASPLRIILWSNRMTETDYRALARIIHCSINQPSQKD